jgi:hypothetical protein
MPAYHFVCGSCQAQRTRICAPEESKIPVLCRLCTGVMDRAPSAPTSQVVEVLDNGLMGRVLQRPADAERIHYEHVHHHEGLKHS